MAVCHYEYQADVRIKYQLLPTNTNGECWKRNNTVLFNREKHRNSEKNR